jgi:hypothetical protein
MPTAVSTASTTSWMCNQMPSFSSSLSGAGAGAGASSTKPMVCECATTAHLAKA